MNRTHLLALLAVLPAFGAGEARLIVRLRPGADPAAVAVRTAVVLRGTTPGAPFALFGARDATAAQARLRLDPGVAWAEDDAEAQNPESAAVRRPKVRKGSSLSVIGDLKAVTTRNATPLARVGWSAALARSAGRPVRLAILDNGLSRRHSDLWGRVEATFDAFGGDADDAPKGNKPDGDVAAGHGTMVASLASIVAPRVRLVIAKVADSDGRATAWTVVQGLAFAANSGAEVANLSLGSAARVPAFNDVAEWCESRGLLIVAPSGNAGVEGAWFPARSSKALCVTGLDEGDVRAEFANWDGGADSAAPAVDLTGLWWDGTLGAWSGTSFAAPFVAAGVADCLRRTAPQSPRTLIRAVNESGRDLDRTNGGRQKGRLGTRLDIAALNARLKGRP